MMRKALAVLVIHACALAVYGQQIKPGSGTSSSSGTPGGTGCTGIAAGTAGYVCAQQGTTTTPLADTAIFQAGTAGTFEISEDGAAFSRACTAANGQCPNATYKQDSTPGTCAVGDTWFDTNATAGSNFYGCTVANTWTLQGSASPETATTSVRSIVPPLGYHMALFDYNIASATTPAPGTAYCVATWVDYPRTIRKFGLWARVPAGSGKGTTIWLEDYATDTTLLSSNVNNASGQPQEFDSGSSYTMLPGVEYALGMGTETASALQANSLFSGGTPTNALAYINSTAVRVFTCTATFGGTGATFLPSASCTSKTALTTASVMPAFWAYY